MALAIVALFATLLTAGAILFLWYDHDREIAKAERRTQAATRLLDEHARRTFASIDILLRRVKERVEARGMDGFRTEADWMFLRDTAALLPESGVMFVYGPDGTTVQGSPRFPPPRTNVGDREYFRAVRDGFPGMHIGRAIHGRTVSALFFTLARRLESGTGHFLGAVHAGIQSDYLTSLYNHLDLGEGAVYGIYRLDGAVVVRHPSTAADISADIKGTPLLDAAQKDVQGTTRVRSPLDGVDRIMSFRRLAGTDVFVAAGMQVETVLVDWHRMVGRVLSALAVVLAAGALLTGMLLAALRRQEHTLIELEAMRCKAEKAHIARSRFLAGIGHDLRQPIQALRLFLDILGETVQKPRHRKIAFHAAQTLESSERLLATLMDVTQLDAGAVKPMPIDFPLLAVLDPIATAAAARASAKGLDFRFRGADVLVRSDPALLERIVRNLIVNAVRYTERGGIVLACRRRGQHVRIEVWDTGPGIAPDKLSAIWEEFYQINARTAADGGAEHGLGLGLSIVQRLCHLLGHSTDVRSRTGRGSVFAVMVPATRRESAGTPPADTDPVTVGA